MKLNKTNVQKALTGWKSSNGSEIPKAKAVETCLNVLEGTEDRDRVVFKPVGGVYTVCRVTQTIRYLNSDANKLTVFDFAD